ncbi:MAG: Na+/H+ antiporter NhaA [Burkholderiaceae bacterium]
MRADATPTDSDTDSPTTPAWLRFIAHESAGGLALGAAALLAIALANSPWQAWYFAFVQLPGELRIGGDALVLAKPLVVWVNDLWMAVFFFLVGLEIKREWSEGELADRRQALLPLVAALGGMVVPALIFAWLSRGDAIALRGWAIPTATDIAFALAVLSLLGPRVPVSLKVFLTAVAIFDDLGAIVVIALFYTDQLSLAMLAGAALGVACLALLRGARVQRMEAYALVGLVIWLFVLKSGVHATLAGVVTALAIPAHGRDGRRPGQELEHGLHPWVAFAILPCFAFVNAGVSLSGLGVSALRDPVTLGIALGLVAGKTVGVLGSVWLLVQLGAARLPSGASWTQMLGIALLCGIGFTMSLFIGSLAFEGQDPAYETRLKLGVLCGSIVAGLAGALVLRLSGAAPRRPGREPGRGQG